MSVADSSTSAGEYLSISEAAAIIGVAKQTLDNWRSAGNFGPPFIKIGRRIVRYKRSALAIWMESSPGIREGAKRIRRKAARDAKPARRRRAA